MRKMPCSSTTKPEPRLPATHWTWGFPHLVWKNHRLRTLCLDDQNKGASVWLAYGVQLADPGTVCSQVDASKGTLCQVFPFPFGPTTLRKLGNPTWAAARISTSPLKHKHMATGQNPNRTPGEHPNPTTKIGSNTGG